jgi:hypothetical protein
MQAYEASLVTRDEIILVGEFAMRVMITLNKTNTGRIQLAYMRSTNERGGIGTGAALPPFNPNAIAEVEEVIRCLGVEEDSIGRAIVQLANAKPGEQVRVADLDVPDGVLRENGFEGVA